MSEQSSNLITDKSEMENNDYEFSDLVPDLGSILDNIEDDTDIEKENEEVIESEETVKETEKDITDEVIADDNEEVDEDKETEDDGLDNEDTNTDESTSFELLDKFAAAFHEEGILPSLNIEGFEKLSNEEKFDSFFESMQTEIKTGIETALSELPKEIYELANNYKEGVPLDQLISLKSEKLRIENIKEDDILNEDNESIRRGIIEKYYKETTKFSDAKIKQLIDRSIAGGNDIDDATDFHKELSEIYKEKEEKLKEDSKNQKEEIIRKRNKVIEDAKKKISEVDEVIKDIPIDKKTKDKIADYMFNPVYDEKGNPISKIQQLRSKDPIQFEHRLAYYASIGLFDDNVDLKAIEQKAETKATKRLKDELTSNKGFKTSKQKTRSSKKDESIDHVISGIESLRKQFKTNR